MSLLILSALAVCICVLFVHLAMRSMDACWCHWDGCMASYSVMSTLSRIKRYFLMTRIRIYFSEGRKLSDKDLYNFFYRIYTTFVCSKKQFYACISENRFVLKKWINSIIGLSFSAHKIGLSICKTDENRPLADTHPSTCRNIYLWWQRLRILHNRLKTGLPVSICWRQETTFSTILRTIRLFYQRRLICVLIGWYQCVLLSSSKI